MIYTELIGKSQFLDEQGVLTGSSVEIVEEIQKRLGDRTEIKVVSWETGYNEIQKMDNVILFSTTLLDVRRDQFKWAGPILRKVWIFYAKKDSGIVIESLEDARKFNKIGAYIDDAREQYLKAEGFTNLDSYPSDSNNVKKLVSNKFDAVIDSPVSFIESCMELGLNPDDFEELFVVKDANLYITFSKNFSEEIYLNWRTTLEEMYNDGTFEKIYKKWYPDSPLPVFKVVG
jgi:polar amino acid transport system substrate-binding protein